jgi:hypothetical protein
MLLLLVDVRYVRGADPERGRALLDLRRAAGHRLTGIDLAGLVARPRRPLWRMGIDSVTVLVTSAVGFVILYHLM